MSRTSEQGLDAAGEPGPEDKAKRELSVWVQEHGANVYWEKRNAWNYPTFSIDHSQPAAKKPDLLIDFGDDVFAVEAKSGLSKSGVYDARWQIMEYWQTYVSDTSAYVAGDGRFEPSGFLTATRWSIDGHLFDPRYEKQIGQREFSEGRNFAVRQGKLPNTEYTMTEQHIREMWRHKKRAVDKDGVPGVGSLLSTALDEGIDSDPAPAVLYCETAEGDWRIYE